MENENTNVESLTSPQDFTELENAITELVEVMKQEQESALAEKELQAEKELENEKSFQTDKEIQTAYQDTMVATQTNQEDIMSNILVEIQALKQDISINQESNSGLMQEGYISVILTIIIVCSVKVFIDQVSRW